MRRTAKIFWALALVAVGLVSRAPLVAQPVTNLPPPPPAIKSPVDSFRELLGMSPLERKKFLEGKPAKIQAGILDKLREYQLLQVDERELRLQATELRWWLLPLMREPATNRATQLAVVPDHLRNLVADRLALWDLVPRPLQKELLDNEEKQRLFDQLGPLTPAQREVILKNLSPERRKELEAGLELWLKMTPAARKKTCDRFERYFELTAAEQKKVFSTLSETERRQMEKTLRSFAKLPPEKRIACLRSFEKFATMDAVDRQLFLKNAERWQLMSPAERQTWRDVVNRIPEMPPLPPGAGGARSVLPPAPPGMAPPLATNRN